MLRLKTFNSTKTVSKQYDSPWLFREGILDRKGLIFPQFIILFDPVSNEFAIVGITVLVLLKVLDAVPKVGSFAM
jgi:hypothetical protein